MSKNDPADLAALIRQAEREREGRERRTAVAAALRDALRDPEIPPTAAMVAKAEGLRRQGAGRRDGTPMTLRDRIAARREAESNRADGITHASTPLETDREDY